jgi:hypothetical protein
MVVQAIIVQYSSAWGVWNEESFAYLQGLFLDPPPKRLEFANNNGLLGVQKPRGLVEYHRIAA